MSITIIKAGICDTIQDAGRPGYGAYGINPCGAMDMLAMQTANALAANDLHEAVIEMHFPAASIQFNSAVLVALSGADFNPMVKLPGGNTVALRLNKSILLPAHSVLTFSNNVSGQRCYLSVNGGFKIGSWLGSSSTNLKIKEGGYHGRILKNGDSIELMRKRLQQGGDFKIFPWVANFYSWYYDQSTYNVIPGPEWDWLDAASQKIFSRNTFITGRNSDRMGISLEGPKLSQLKKEQLVSSGVVYGTIQLLPNGNMVILAADHPTTGGYPRIANIIRVHLPKLAQVSPGINLKFFTTTVLNAAEMFLLQQKEIIQMQQAVKLQVPSI